MTNMFYSPPDPFLLQENAGSNAGFNNPNGFASRSQAINTGLKNLVLITAGQSNICSVNPSLYTPTSSSVIDNFSIYDGGSYAISGPLLGCTYGSGLGSGGNISARVAQLFVTNAIFDRVIIVPVALGGTTAADWAVGNCSLRIPVAMKRLASRGITPATTGVTFALLWSQGEQDGINGTSSASYQASMATVLSNAQAAGFSGRAFICTQTLAANTTSATIQAAQAAVVTNDPTHWFAGGNSDSLTTATNRQADGTHLNDTGAASDATLKYNAMHATGAPF